MFVVKMHILCLLLAQLPTILAYDTTFAFNSSGSKETRSVDEIHQAALAESGVVTLWHPVT
jgi:hypothetical protein